MIIGHMQPYTFNLIKIIQHAARWHGEVEIVTNTVEGGIHRITYAQLYERIKKLANALSKLGVTPGDRVGTMAWNTWRHFECWYGIGGFGAVSHTLNPRLFPDQLEYIIGHAQNEFIFVDLSFVDVIAVNIEKLPSLKGIIILTDKEHMPETSHIPLDVYCYEDLIAPEDTDYDWLEFDENTASSLCYTSGTTGNPKGVLYSHRSNMAHAWATSGADVFNVTSNDTALMVVPMFHANSWGLAFSVPMAGAKLVLPGPHMDGESIYKVLSDEKITTSAAVPTVWTGLLNYLDDNQLQLPYFKETIIGGSAVPLSMIERFDKDYDVAVRQVWGMTEMSPLGTLNRPIPALDSLPEKERLEMRAKQGRVAFGVDMKIVNEEGMELARDGVAFGRLMVKGPWVIERYYKSETTALDADGWLNTGDIATIDKYGYMQITDRSKDLIKSGGEWISSVDIENTAVGHPELDIAACVGIHHSKWEERPLLFAVKRAGCNPSVEAIRTHIAKDHAKWQIPDNVIFIDEMPLTATGKIDKKVLRVDYANFYENA